MSVRSNENVFTLFDTFIYHVTIPPVCHNKPSDLVHSIMHGKLLYAGYPYTESYE